MRAGGSEQRSLACEGAARGPGPGAPGASGGARAACCRREQLAYHRRTHPNTYCGQKFGRHFLLFSKILNFNLLFEHISLDLHNRKYA